MAYHCYLRSFIVAEVARGSTNSLVKEVDALLKSEYNNLVLQLNFLTARAQPILDLLDKIQVSVSPTWGSQQQHLRPQSHRVFNQLLKLEGQLADKTSLGALVDEVGAALSGAVRDALVKPFKSALDAALAKLRKYLPKLPFLKQARVFDPRQREAIAPQADMGKELSAYIHVIRPTEICADLRADWEVYWKLPQVQSTRDFQILDWWRQMDHLMPKLAGIARRALAVPATGCDVERAFSSLKWVKDERQRGMHEDSHIAAVLLHFNGAVPS